MSSSSQALALRCFKATFYGLGLETYDLDLGLKVPGFGLGLESM